MRGEISEAAGAGAIGKVPQRRCDRPRVGGTRRRVGIARRSDRELHDIRRRKTETDKIAGDVAPRIVEDFARRTGMGVPVAGDDDRRPIAEAGSERGRDAQQNRAKRKNQKPVPHESAHPRAKDATSSICSDQRNWSTGTTGPMRKPASTRTLASRAKLAASQET